MSPDVSLLQDDLVTIQGYTLDVLWQGAKEGNIFEIKDIDSLIRRMTCLTVLSVFNLNSWTPKGQSSWSVKRPC